MITALYFLSILVLVINGQVAPSIPKEALPPRENAEPYKEENLCAFLKPNIPSVPYSFWTCGVPFKQTYCGSEISFDYQCCPGFMKSPLLNNQCGETISVWKTLPEHLTNYTVPKFSELIKNHAQLPDIFNETGVGTYTVFAPYSDSAMKQGDFDLSSANGSPHPISMHISKYRTYSDQIKNGALIKTLFDDHKLKVTTYSNGLVFIDCRALVSPDHETKNGVIHYISGPITPHIGSGIQRKTVLQTLQNDPMTNSFYNDIPSDMRTLLDQETDNSWSTVFAPQNEVWKEAKSKYSGRIPLLVKNHILNRMICAQAITRKANSLGPSMADEYLGVDCSSDGSRAILNPCGGQAGIVKEDLVAGNGVVQVINKVLVPTSAMPPNEAVNCLSQGNPKVKLSNILQQMNDCNLNLNRGSKYLLLIPTDEAFDSLQTDPIYGSEYERIMSDKDYKCKVLRYHTLRTKHNPLIVINQKPLDSNLENGGKPLPVTPYFVKYRDGSKLFFNSAKTSQLEPRKFNQGYIHFVDKINIPPSKTIMQILDERSDISVLSSKLKESGFDSQLKSYGDHIVFLAWQNHGWETRKEKKWSSSQLEKLFQLHTIKMKLWGADEGYFDRETYSEVNSAYMEGGAPFELKIKRELNGNTYIGYEGLPFELWSLVISSNHHAIDGMIWVIDWPLKFRD